MIRTNQTHKNYIGTKPVIAEVFVGFFFGKILLYVEMHEVVVGD